MKDLTQNPDLRQRDVPDDYFGDWKWREGVAELMVPIIGTLYRNGINIMMYGQSLVNLSPTAIMKRTDLLGKLKVMNFLSLKLIHF